MAHWNRHTLPKDTVKDHSAHVCQWAVIQLPAYQPEFRPEILTEMNSPRLSGRVDFAVNLNLCQSGQDTDRRSRGC